MQGNFICKSCKNEFSADGQKKEYNDPVFGPCAYYYAVCPSCGEESKEKPTPKLSGKTHKSAPACGMQGGGCSCCG